MADDRQATVLVIVGPTAVGKSVCALQACERFNGELVSVDSMQVYRGLDVATSKPTGEERARVRHHGIDLADPGEDFSLGDFVRAASNAIATIAKRGRLPVLVGGTGLYLRGLLRGIIDAPPRNEAIRSRLRSSAERHGETHLPRMLGRVDPEAARRLGSRDRQRIIRALEVFFTTRRGLSEWIRQSPYGDERYEAIKIGLNMERAALYRRIDSRVARFFEAGLIEEVRGLLQRGFPRQGNAFKALGYRETLALLDGTIGLEQAIETTRRNTRRYAKRQLTWYRSEPRVQWFDLDPAAGAPCTEPLAYAEKELKARGYRWTETAQG